MAKTVVHNTKVRINRVVLEGLIAESFQAFNDYGDLKRETPKGRSLFSITNNMSKMRDRLFDLFDTVTESKVIETQGVTDLEACARVYYEPSLTSLPAQFRKCIEPVKSGNKFLYFDLKAAEFFLACYFAGEESVVSSYYRGEDIYDKLSVFFPEGTPRKHYKTVILSSLYGSTYYSTMQRLGVSEDVAKSLHSSVSRALPKLSKFRSGIIQRAKDRGYYVYPTNLDQTAFLRVPYKKVQKTGKVGFSPNLAVSVYIQSALGYFIQRLISKADTLFKFDQSGTTFLTVFDSVLIESEEGNFNKLANFFIEAIKPFQVDGFGMGDTFYDAYVNAEKMNMEEYDEEENSMFIV